MFETIKCVLVNAFTCLKAYFNKIKRLSIVRLDLLSYAFLFFFFFCFVPNQDGSHTAKTAWKKRFNRRNGIVLYFNCNWFSFFNRAHFEMRKKKKKREKKKIKPVCSCKNPVIEIVLLKGIYSTVTIKKKKRGRMFHKVSVQYRLKAATFWNSFPILFFFFVFP